MKGERSFKLEFSDMTVFFDEASTIQFVKDEEIICQLQPSELSAIYGAFRQMEKELAEDEREGK